MSSIILTSFNGKNNSSFIFAEELSKATNAKNIIIKNSYNQCTNTIYEVLLKGQPKFLLSFGLKPKTDTVFIETRANYAESLTTFFPSTKEKCYKTNFDYNDLHKNLKAGEVNVSLSKNPGSYLCNHLYYSGLHYINALNLETKYIFIHVPSLKNFSSYDKLLNYFKTLIYNIHT